MSYKWKILIVDDMPEMLISLKKSIEDTNKTIITTEHALTVPAFLQEENVDLIICDLMMPKMSGMQLLRKVKQICPATPIIMISAYGTVDKAVDAMKKGAYTFLEKPFTSERLNVVVDKAIEHRQLLLERDQLLNRLSHDVFAEIIGKSESMRHIKDNIKRVAPTETSVLITGETGVGKEKVARAIHDLSNRKKQPFIAINCSAVPEQLFESELFGHEKGSFTGAHQSKNGLIEEAHGGTLFMDEIGELQPSLQVKLLRALEERKIRHVGGTKNVPVNVRIIAATNLNIDQALKNKTLREDLYYRLSVFHFHIPPLRERKEDIPLLAHYFLLDNSTPGSNYMHSFSASTLECLENYDWPGNIRELRNCVERALVLAPDRTIEVEDLPEKIIQSRNGELTIHSDLNFVNAKNKLLNEFEHKYLVKLLKKHFGNVSEAAKESGVSRRTFYRLMEKYNIATHLWREK